jgi:hypothetical protein
VVAAGFPTVIGKVSPEAFQNANHMFDRGLEHCLNRHISCERLVQPETLFRCWRMTSLYEDTVAPGSDARHSFDGSGPHFRPRQLALTCPPGPGQFRDMLVGVSEFDERGVCTLMCSWAPPRCGISKARRTDGLVVQWTRNESDLLFLGGILRPNVTLVYRIH